MFVTRLGESAAPGGGGVQAVPRLCIVYPDICITIERKSRKNLSQGNAVRLVPFIVLCRSSIQILFVLRLLSSWMWRRLLVSVSDMVTSVIVMHTGRHTPYGIVTTEVGLRVKSQVGFFACHGNQMTVAVVKRFVSFF